MKELKKERLTQERLKDLLNYDPDTGIFAWKVGRRGVKRGSIAGTPNAYGYIRICIDGKNFYASRLAFLWVEGYFPENDVDHIDRDRSNNRWLNLREASRSCNMRNCGIICNNKSGVTGVSWDKLSSKWRSDITIYGKSVPLGRFKFFVEAVKARWEAEVKYNFPNCKSDSAAYKYLQEIEQCFGGV